MTDREKAMIEKMGLSESDFAPKDRISILEERLSKLIDMQGLTVAQIDSHQFEVIKDEVATGDYTDPILFNPPMDIEESKWYYTEEIGKDLPREALCDANKVTDFDNRMVFDWV